MKRDFKGVWIPKEIWLEKGLSWMEKLFLTEINSLDNEEGCYASNNYFAAFFQLTGGRCSQIINSLVDKKYISRELIKDGNVCVKRVLRILSTGIKNSKGGTKYSKGGYLENAEGINTNINNTLNNKDKLPKQPVSDHLLLTDKEQKDLIEEFGETLLHEVYEEIENWIYNKQKGKFTWKDHKRGIKNWIKRKREFEKGKATEEIKYCKKCGATLWDGRCRICEKL